jgi:transposase
MSNSNISKRLAQVKPGTLHAGVDLALNKNVVIVMDENARQCDRFSFPQDADGYRYFLARLEKVRQKQGASQVVIAMEPTNFFWKLLANWLEGKEVVYHLVNAYTVNKHREGDQIDRSKDDPRDAFVIGDLSRTGKYTDTQLQRGVYAELREYATLYYQTMKSLAREKSILWGLIGQVFPELHQAFKEFSGKTISALLKTCPAAATIRALSEEDFIAKVSAAFRGQRLCKSKLRQTYRLASTSIGLVDGLRANALAVQIHLGRLEALQTDIFQIIMVFKNCLMQLDVAKYLLSVKALNTLSVALILAEIGDPARYSCASQLVKLAGIQPVPNSSGRKQRSATPMSHQGRPGLRATLYFACLRLIQVDSRFQEVYLSLQKRAKNPLTKMQALGVLMNKLLHVLWALISQKISYDPNFSLAV